MYLMMNGIIIMSVSSIWGHLVTLQQGLCTATTDHCNELSTLIVRTQYCMGILQFT